MTNLTAPEQCSTCNASAEWEIRDADPTKGNLACTSCVNRFWPISQIRRLTEAPDAG